ncbi:MAG: glycoside hydrolase family 127 protein [Chitinispirillaceae bacterium]|nr:glycoside hydrolase family 127 protein [Chitinispirillaceae bacterium]
MKSARSLSAFATVLCIVGSAGTAGQAAPEEKYVVVPFFPDSQVALSTGSPWKVAETRVSNALNAMNVKNFLYNFRKTYGLSTSGYGTCGVWEAPDCNLRGHATGHVLSALALNYAATKNAAIKAKIRQLVDGLDTCQQLAASKGMSEGCLSAFGEDLFTSLENGGTYGGNPNVWAPWYSQHKILAGLVDCYRHAGDTVALRMAKAMGRWAYNRLSKLSKSTLQSMWTRYIAGEYGGYNEAAVELYFVTGDTTFIRLAQLFDETTSRISLDKLAADVDNLAGEHANQLVPRIIGYLREYDATGTAAYLNAAANFWDMVDLHHRFGFGGVSTAESFMAKDAMYANIQVARSNETCPTYNMVKLSRVLFYHNPQSKYMDYWERANSAQLLANANVAGASPTATQPFACYMTNVKCGESKARSSSGDSYDMGGLYGYTCCDGTGLESHVRYFRGVYAYSQDTLFINQFIASTLNWAKKAKKVEIVTNYPVSDTVTIKVNGEGTMPVRIRSPWWVRRPVLIWVDGVQRHIGRVPPSTYFTIDATRGWKGSGEIRLVLPKTLRVEACNDRPSTGQVFFGGLALYGVTSNTSFQSLDCGTFKKGDGLTWTASGFTFKPFYNVAADNYSMYWNISNVPSTWQDTVLDEVDDPPVSVDPAPFSGRSNAATAYRAASSGFRLLIRFSAALPGERPLHVRVCNAKGVKIMDLKGTAHKGDRSAETGASVTVPSAGLYICIVSIGGDRFSTPVVVGR